MVTAMHKNVGYIMLSVWITAGKSLEMGDGCQFERGREPGKIEIDRSC